MAYLTLASTDDKQSTCFRFIGSNTPTQNGGLISSNTSLITDLSSDCGLDSCSFYNGPSDSDIMAFGESYETTGSIAYSGETCGSIAFAGSGETCGSIASSSSFSSNSSFGGGCSYSC